MLISFVEVDGRLFYCPLAEFSSTYDSPRLDGRLVVADPITAETPLKNAKNVSGKIVLVQRGGCDFLSKTIQVQKAGAIAIIVANTDEENPELAFVMDAGLTRSGISAKIPALMAPFATAQHLLDLVGAASSMKLNVSIVLMDAAEASAVLDAQGRLREQQEREADALRMQQEREKKQREATMLLRSRLVKDNQAAKVLVDHVLPLAVDPPPPSTLAVAEEVSTISPVVAAASAPLVAPTASSAGAVTAEPVKAPSAKLHGVVQANATSLVVLDVQYYCAMPHVGKHSNMDHAANKEYYFDRIKTTMVPNIQAILHMMRQRSMEIVYATIESMTKNGRDRSKAHKLAGIHVAKHSFDAKVLESVAPTDYDIVIPRTAVSLLGTTTADYVLRNLGIACLVVVGVSTLGTLETTVRDALDRGYAVLVVEDAVAFETPDEHAHVMKSTARMGAHILQTRDFLFEVQATCPPRFAVDAVSM